MGYPIPFTMRSPMGSPHGIIHLLRQPVVLAEALDDLRWAWQAGHNSLDRQHMILVLERQGRIEAQRVTDPDDVAVPKDPGGLRTGLLLELVQGGLDLPRLEASLGDEW